MLRITDLKEGMELVNESNGDIITIESINMRQRTAYCNVYDEIDDIEENHLYYLQELTRPYIKVRE